MDIFVATNNAHKVTELGPALIGHRLRIPADAGIANFEVDEDGSTYLENAAKKAFALYRLIGKPCLADDSGLSVHAMGGAPGVMSARYGAQELSHKAGADLFSTTPPQRLSASDRNTYLLERMAGIEDRTCAFVCCLVLVMAEDRFFSVQETCPGEVLLAPRGTGGFGYDPIVWLPNLGKTVAELTIEEKNALSHRGRACARMARILADLEVMP